MSTHPVPAWELAHHERIDPHGGHSSLSDVILGAQDGIVAVLAVLLGVSAAGAGTRLALAAGLATACAEAVSMAAVAYTTTVAEIDRYRSEEERERRHLRTVPELERDEVRALYARKGFEGELLDRIVATITSDPDVWVAVMMAEEHGLVPVERASALRSAVVVGLAAVVGSLLPVAPYVWLPPRLASWIAVAVAAGALFAIGAYKARVTLGHPVRSGLVIAAIGLASALAGWGIGALFGAAP